MDETALFDLSYGLYVIGAKSENGPVGCIANTAFQITAFPPRVALSLSYDNYTTACIQNTREFTVSILSTDIDPAIIGTFGFQSSRDTNKFQKADYKEVFGGLPVLTKNCTSWFHCKVENIVDAGTHVVFIAEVVETEKMSGQIPMTYAYYHQVIKGSAPKNAPTYRGENTPEKTEDTYICDLCKYEYTGDFDALPEDWVCPICKAPKSKFHKRS